jgi:hypothetical protein
MFPNSFCKLLCSNFSLGKKISRSLIGGTGSSVARDVLSYH